MFAIRSIELKLDEGDLFGFIGPNGAGKTTTMRIIATLLNPTWGEAYVCGNSIYTRPGFFLVKKLLKRTQTYTV